MRVLPHQITSRLMAAMLGIITLGIAASPVQADGQPKHKDTSARLKPKEVTFVTKVEPAKAKPGDTVTYTVTMTLDQPWHVYAYVKAQPAANGPRGTQFDFFDPAGLKLAGDWTSSEPPKVKLDEQFDNLKVEYYEGEVSWSAKLKVPADAKPGKKTLRSQIYFQICDPKSCKPPAYMTLPDATVTITANGAAFSPIDRSAMTAALLVAATPTAAVSAPSGELGAAINGGLLSFLLYSALGGLFAVLMPCVWPMIPITVNFFVKQGESKNGSPTKLAFAYCLAIIGIFTAIGLAVTAALGAPGASQLGNNKWVNLLFGVAFIGLGLSLLGLFEVRLPTFLLNASAQNEGKGGLVGVMFMATTLTITSFTCTAPVVGTLLILATKGQFFYPVLGLLTFSTVLALPFFVLALMPGLMRKMPRSGDWMNAVKVVGAMVEIALAFKFLNTAEIGFGASSSSAWIDAQVVLTIWVATAVACGVYLLGLFRTNHDHEAIQVGPIRLIAGVGFLATGLFLAPALFGNPPHSRIYSEIVGILPPDSGELDTREDTIRRTVTEVAEIVRLNPAQTASRGSEGNRNAEAEIRGPIKATSADPKEAILQEKKFHGVPWGLSYEAAVAEAKAKKKLLFIDFTGLNCTNCRKVEQGIMPKPEVVAELKKFVTVSLYTDFADIDSITTEQREALAIKNQEREVDMIGTNASPAYVIATPEGKVLGQAEYNADPGFLLKFIRETLAKVPAGEKVAQGGGM